MADVLYRRVKVFASFINSAPVVTDVFLDDIFKEDPLPELSLVYVEYQVSSSICIPLPRQKDRWVGRR